MKSPTQSAWIAQQPPVPEPGGPSGLLAAALDTPAVLSVLTTIAVAAVGWAIVRDHRRRDRQRADLDGLAELLRRTQVLVHALAERDDLAIQAELTELRTLTAELECATAPPCPRLTGELAHLARLLHRLSGTAVPTGPMGPGDLATARRQGQAIQEVLTALRILREGVQRLRSR